MSKHFLVAPFFVVFIMRRNSPHLPFGVYHAGCFSVCTFRCGNDVAGATCGVRRGSRGESPRMIQRRQAHSAKRNQSRRKVQNNKSLRVTPKKVAMQNNSTFCVATF